ncbi:MAG: transcriptional regulator [Pseudomonadota bacterium]|jgi:hypothetical protein
MEAHSGTLLTIICEAGLEPVLVADLVRLGARGYTICDTRGMGSRGMRDALWEGSSNIRVEVLGDRALIETLVAHVHDRYYANYGMVLFVTEVEVLRPEKFLKRPGEDPS